MSKRVIIIIGGSVILVLLAAGYFIWFSGSVDLFAKKSELGQSIARAQAKLDAQKQSLSAKTNALIKSFPLGASVQDHMRKSSEIVQDTNFLFNEAESSHPELVINTSKSSLINDQRRNINFLLAEWQTKLGVSSLSTIDILQSKKIKEDTGAIRAFIKELSDLLVDLTPQNSGLSQAEIDAYLSQLPSVGAVDELLANLQVAIDNPTVNTVTTSTTSSQLNNSNVSAVVTLEDDVEETENEIVNLQTELAQVEQQIAQSTPSTTSVTTVTTTPTTTTTPTPSQTTSGGTYTPPPRRVITPSTGIIVQPGPPVLIPGIDDH